MRKALEPTEAPNWVLSHEGYYALSKSAVESRLAFANGFLGGVRAARSVSRGPTLVAWLGHSRWASWPRCYVAGLFDIPNTEPPVPALVPVADWSRVRILLDGQPLLAREGEVLVGTRKLDMQRGLLLSSWTQRTPAGITATGRELRLLSQADRATGLQLLRLSLDRNVVDVRLEASSLWQAVMFGFVGLNLKGDTLGIDPKLPPHWRSLSFRVRWRGRSVAISIKGRTVEATLVGEAVEMRIGTITQKLATGKAMRLSI